MPSPLPYLSMRRIYLWTRYAATAAILCIAPAFCLRAQSTPPHDRLKQGFEHPAAAARLRCYWWWLNGHTNKAAITRDLEQMAKMGYGGAILVDADGSNQGGNENVPAGPEFGSPAWTALYVHALQEANRLGLEITLNITSGWNLGGPNVTPEQASKLLTWSRDIVQPGEPAPHTLSIPAMKNGFYRQIAVLAYPLQQGVTLAGAPGSLHDALPDLQYKSASAELGFSMPKADWLLTDPSPGKEDSDTKLDAIQNITAKVDPSGELHWSPPAGSNMPWEILRIGYTDSDGRVSTSSGAWQGLAIDYLDPRAFDLYWNTSVAPLLKAGAPYVGKSLKYVATDSWELGGTNWTRDFAEEFRRRRGYDPTPYLPVVAGRIVGSREQSTQFLADLRRTVGDLVNTHYDRMAARAHPYGLGIQCESGGPHGAPLDGLETFRSSAIPQTEYWAMSKQHRSSDTDRFFVKEASSAAHIYGRPFAAAEGMTSIGNQWNESIGMNLRPSFDRALTEGMNRLVWHEFTSSPPELGLPGQEYFAGTHLNPNVTWWHVAEPLFQYLNRSQFLLQQGLPVSDLLYYYGDNVPNFVRLKSDDPAKVLPGYDYDVIDTEALLQRITFAGGTLRTPEGIHYRALALPSSRILPLSVLRWMARYVEVGGNLIGLRPLRSQGIVSAGDEREFQTLALRLWQSCEADPSHAAAVGKGHLYCTPDAHNAFVQMRVLPDFEGQASTAPLLDYVHRTTPDAEIYFLRNTTPQPIVTSVVLRAHPGQPEIFHADTGEIDSDLLFSPTTDGRTRLRLTLGAYDSVFVVLRHHAPDLYVKSIENESTTLYNSSDAAFHTPPLQILRKGSAIEATGILGSYRVTLSSGVTTHVDIVPVPIMDISNSWTLTFPDGWGAPPQLQVDALKSWTDFDDPGIRYFSGSAVYHKTLTLTQQQASQLSNGTLELGDVFEVASVRINGSPAGIAWKQPYIVNLAALLHVGENQIDAEVTNLWPNRIIGDLQDSSARHYTWTNIRFYKKDSPLLPSGLIGPVRLRPPTSVLLPLKGMRNSN